MLIGAGCLAAGWLGAGRADELGRSPEAAAPAEATALEVETAAAVGRTVDAARAAARLADGGSVLPEETGAADWGGAAGWPRGLVGLLVAAGAAGAEAARDCEAAAG